MANDFFYKKLIAYQKGKIFTRYVYSLVSKFPSCEQYALCDQLRRAAISIPSKYRAVSWLYLRGSAVNSGEYVY